MRDKLQEMISFFTEAVTNFEEGKEVFKDHYIETFNATPEDCEMPQFCMNCNCLSFQCVWGVSDEGEGEEEQLCPSCFNRAYFVPTREEIEQAKKFKKMGACDE